MNAIFDWCVQLLVTLAGQLGITYKEINVWIFVIIWPVVTLILIAIVLIQYRRICSLQKKLED
jgi:hypothetical protein